MIPRIEVKFRLSSVEKENIRAVTRGNKVGSNNISAKRH
jgi:hypothetical protein